MALVFKTKKNSVDNVELVGGGMLGPGGKGGVSIEDAAQFMPELQEQADDGRLLLDPKTQQPIPLEGRELSAAARKFAKDRDLEVVEVSQEKLAELPQEVGAAAARPPLVEISQQKHEERYGHLVHSGTPEQMSGHVSFASVVKGEEKEDEQEIVTGADAASAAADAEKEGGS